MNTTRLLEGHAIDVWKQWFGVRPVFAPGPTDFEIVDYVEEKSVDKVGVTDFLDAVLDKYGPNSVVYVSSCSPIIPLTTFIGYSIDIVRINVVDYGAGESVDDYKRPC